MKLFSPPLPCRLFLLLGLVACSDEPAEAEFDAGRPIDDDHLLHEPEESPVEATYGTLEGVAFANPSTFAGWVFGGQPSETDLAALKARGITKVIDLRTEAEDRGFDEPAACEALGLEYHALPFSPRDLDDATLDAILAEFEGGEPALVHCGSGNRVQLMFSLHRILNDGVDAETAIAEGCAHGMSEGSAEVVRQILADRQG